jgi:serine/threonine protein kinase
MNDSFDDAATLPTAQAEVPRVTLGVGDALGSFRIIRLLGRGGMGEVYEVEHTGLDKRYALKLLPPDFARQPGAVERFRREAKVMAHLEHPHIIQVDDSGETNGRYWLRMALAGGVDVVSGEQRTRVVSLQELADAMGGKLPADTLAELLRQILDGLGYAHAHGAIHRDLKPGNILLSQVGGKLHAKISDFGLVKLVGEEWLRTKTAESVRLSVSLGDMATLAGAGQSTRSLVGTYEYMSPEQKRGEEADARSDLYAVGLIAFRLLTGRQDFSFDLPSQIDSSLAPAWDRLVKSCLKPDRNRRVIDCESLKELLTAVLRQPFQSLGKPAAPDSNPWETELLLLQKTVPIQNPAEESQSAAPENVKLERLNASPKRNQKIGALLLTSGLLILGTATYLTYKTYFEHSENSRQIEAQPHDAQIPNVEKRQQLATLLTQAEQQIAADQTREAAQSLATAFALDPANAAVQKLQTDLEAKIGEQKARSAKVNAELVWERLQKRQLDPGQEIGERRLAIEGQIRLAREAYNRQEWDVAINAYQVALTDIRTVEGLEKERGAAQQRTKKLEADLQAAKDEAEALRKARPKAGSDEGLSPPVASVNMAVIRVVEVNLPLKMLIVDVGAQGGMQSGMGFVVVHEATPVAEVRAADVRATFSGMVIEKVYVGQQPTPGDRLIKARNSDRQDALKLTAEYDNMTFKEFSEAVMKNPPLKIQGFVNQPNRRYAMINGRLVTAGDSLYFESQKHTLTVQINAVLSNAVESEIMAVSGK